MTKKQLIVFEVLKFEVPKCAEISTLKALINATLIRATLIFATLIFANFLQIRKN